ncbi:hypothetical protein BJ508DRAFT_316361 [Ascobolus immersus RN42]|uniref:Uncharacterized protein n=1 Tax=Ascobolus immersus RN42 TaxID=1160509 RepID=A0A3N4HLS5_ASCIM|nr:hypothetical protein BJ508DRAFT_316361 [Ascobolus immersus RN42]
MSTSTNNRIVPNHGHYSHHRHTSHDRETRRIEKELQLARAVAHNPAFSKKRAEYSQPRHYRLSPAGFSKFWQLSFPDLRDILDFSYNPRQRLLSVSMAPPSTEHESVATRSCDRIYIAVHDTVLAWYAKQTTGDTQYNNVQCLFPESVGNSGAKVVDLWQEDENGKHKNIKCKSPDISIRIRGRPYKDQSFLFGEIGWSQGGEDVKRKVKKVLIGGVGGYRFGFAMWACDIKKDSYCWKLASYEYIKIDKKHAVNKLDEKVVWSKSDGCQPGKLSIPVRCLVYKLSHDPPGTYLLHSSHSTQLRLPSSVENSTIDIPFAKLCNDFDEIFNSSEDDNPPSRTHEDMLADINTNGYVYHSSRSNSTESQGGSDCSAGDHSWMTNVSDEWDGSVAEDKKMRSEPDQPRPRMIVPRSDTPPSYDVDAYFEKVFNRNW